MKVTSSAFDNNSPIPSKYSCHGENINPSLTITDVPQDIESLVLIVDDPDAPRKTWVHWVVFDIDSQVTEIAENSVPKGGVEGMTDFGKPGYGGPCPPSGTHRYFFKLYALDTKLGLSSNATQQDIEQSLNGHILTSAELIGLYSHTP